MAHTSPPIDPTRRLIELLRAHHGKEEWATFVELRNGTGSNSTTGIDFFAIHTWPSKNYRTIAYEIKVSRADFAKEIQSPLKRAFAESVSHEAYFVTPVGLVRADEVPEGWGLMVADAGGLKTLKHATQRARVEWSKTFIVGMLRRVSDPPPQLPVALWKVQGQEMDEAQLLALCEKLYADSTQVRERTIRLEERVKAQREITEGDIYQALLALRQAVAAALDVPVYYATAAKFEEWCANSEHFAEWLDRAKGDNLSPAKFQKVQAAMQLLSEVVRGT